MTWRIFVLNKPNFTDHRGKGLEKEWRHAGLRALKTIRTGQAYELSGALSRADAEKLAVKLLTDPVTQVAEIAEGAARGGREKRRAEIWPRQGVADPVADTVLMAAHDLSFKSIDAVKSGQVYDFWGAPSPKDVQSFCEEHLMNKLVQKVEVL